MEKKFDVIALGELLIDFTENGVSAQGNPIFEANPGGAPCNVLAMLQKLGRKTAFIGMSRQDMEEMLVFANAAASVITTRKGALRVMPTRDEIQKTCEM